MSFVVDSHAHVLAADLASFPTLPLTDEVRQRCFSPPFTAERLVAAMAAGGVGQALVVQRSQIYGCDNAYVCEAARLSLGRLFCVVAVDGGSPGCVNDAAAWVDRGAVGLRLMQQSTDAGLDWLGGAQATALWRFAAERGVPMCVHLFASAREIGLPLLRRLIDDHPGVRVVIDHLSNQPVADDRDGPDALIRAFADYGNVALKFTAIPLARWREQGIAAPEILRRFVAAFGADRMMWGSDVSQSTGSYEELLALGHEATAPLADGERAMLMGGTAARFYKLEATTGLSRPARAAE